MVSLRGVRQHGPIEVLAHSMTEDLFTIHHRYRVQKYLGGTAPIAVFSAHDTLRDGEVMTSIVGFPDLSQDVWQEFLLYYEALSQWSQKSGVDFIAPVVAFGEFSLGQVPQDTLSWEKTAPHQRACYFVTPARAGWNLFARKTLAPAEIGPYFLRVLQALSWLRQQGIACYHLSPWTILYNAKSQSPQIALLNAGVIPPGHALFPSPYTAPALSDREDERAELYSAAATFYFLTTGKPPGSKSESTLSSLAEFGVAQPVAEILGECLTPAGGRFSTIAGAAFALHGAGEGPKLPRLSAHYPLTPDFCHVPLLDELATHLARLGGPDRPQKIACFVNGGPGEGKTALLNQVKSICARSNFKVLPFTISPNSGWLLPPLNQFLSGVIRAQSRHSLVAGEDPTGAGLPDCFAMSVDEAYLGTRTRIVQNILKEAEEPLVLAIDNIHWCSEETLDILCAAIRTLACEPQHVCHRLFIIGAGTYSDGEWKNFCRRVTGDSQAVINEILPQGQLPAEKFIAGALGIEKAPEFFSARVREITRSNPLYVRQILTNLLAQNGLYWEDGEWYIEADSVEELTFPENLGKAIDVEFTSLSPACRDLLQTLATFGCPLKWKVLAQVCPDQIFPAIWQLYRDRVVGVDEKFRFFPLSATAWGRWPKLAALPVSLGEKFDKDDITDEFLLAYTALEYGEPFRAETHLGQVISLLLDLGFGATLNRWLHRCRAEKSAANWLGEAAFLAGQYRLAADCLQQSNSAGALLRLAEIALVQRQAEAAGNYLKMVEPLLTGQSEALYLRLKGWLALIHEEIQEFLSSWQNGLSMIVSSMDEEGPRDRQQTLLTRYYQMSGHESFIAFCDLAPTWLLKGADLAQRLQNLPLSMNFLRLLAVSQKNLCDYAQAMENLQKSLETAHKLCHPAGEALALLELADTYLSLGSGGRAQECLACALHLCEREQMESILGYCRLLSGRQFLLSRQYSQAIGQCREALVILRKHHKDIESGFALGYLSESFTGIEDMANALGHWGEGVEIAQRLGYPVLKICFDLLKAKIDNSEGQKPAKILRLLNPALALAQRHGYRQYLWQLYYQKAIAHQSAGEMEKAVEGFREAWTIVEESARRLGPELRENYLLTPGPKTIKDNLALFTAELPSPAPGVFSSKEVAMDESPSRLEEIVRNCRKEVESAHLNVLREENENLKKLLSINNKLNSEHELQRLLDLIMDTAIEITKAERGFLILASTSKDKQFEVARNFEREDIANPQFEISHSITEKVVQSGVPVLSKDALEEFDGYRSVSELKLHSLLAVPLRIKESVIGALYLDNRFERAVFSEKDKILLESFADQAALAIENARMLQENLRLNKELAVANAKLSKKVESQKAEIKYVTGILHRAHSEWEGEGRRYYDIVGKSALMQEVFKMLDKVSDKNIPIFIHGESGTGKELVAKAIHFNSSRKDQNFLSENCASIIDSLLESELFGHVKGAFTGAYRDKQGLFEQATGGTLFLDEVGDMSHNMQASLLRVLETNLIRRVGGKDSIQVDVRIISASNKDLKSLVERGEFRKDLFFRLKVVQINLPPLRQRKEDIPLLVEHFLGVFAKEAGGEVRRLDKKAMQMFVNYDWPGNVRELRNVLYNVLSIHDDADLTDAHFRDLLTPSGAKSDVFTEELSIDEYAKRFVLNYQSKYNDSQLSRILGFSRKTLWEKRKKWELFRS